MFYLMVCWLFVLLFLVFVEFSDIYYASNDVDPEGNVKAFTFQENVIQVNYWERPPPHNRS